MSILRLACAAAIFLLPGSQPAAAHSGGLEENGCHYKRASDGRPVKYHCHAQPKPNPDQDAPVKKSRENVCHDASSPNYHTIRYFSAYPDMPACVNSGGRKAQQ
jgi:hypothetical protein